MFPKNLIYFFGTTDGLRPSRQFVKAEEQQVVDNNAISFSVKKIATDFGNTAES